MIDGANNATATVNVGSSPIAVAVNLVTNKVYVANNYSSNVTAIDGATNTTTTVTAGHHPIGVAVNPVTNKVYVSNDGDGNVTVIDGASNTTATVSVGGNPNAAAVNPVTNKVYVPNTGTGNVTVIDGATNTTATLTGGTDPWAAVVNSVTNKVYVANNASNDVTVIDGAANATTTLSTGTAPHGAVLNPVTNKVYIPNSGSGNVTVIDGATNTTATVTAGTSPSAIGVNPVTAQIYVANTGSGNVTVIDGATNSTATVVAGTSPGAVAVSPVTNKVYVTNKGSNNVTVIDGVTNSTTVVTVGNSPNAVAVNPWTNKVYVANSGSSNVSVIDGATNTTATVTVGTSPSAVAVNPLTNKIYVTNSGSSDVTVIDGTANGTITVSVGANPSAVVVNPVTNKIYVANAGSNKVTVIDGATNTTTTVNVGTNPSAVVVNPVTNKIYVANAGSNNVTVIDGASNSTSTVTAGAYAWAAAVNAVTNKVYVANQTDNTMTVIDVDKSQPMPVTVSVAGVQDALTVTNANVFETKNSTPQFAATVTSAFAGSGTYGSLAGVADPAPTAVYYSVDGATPLQAATMSSALGTNPGIFNINVPLQNLGMHTLFLYAAYGNESGHDSSAAGGYNSPELSNLASYFFEIDSSSTVTAISADVNPQNNGAKVTFTATVTPSGRGMPTGTVVFNDGASQIGTAPLVSGSGSNTATFSTTGLAVGSHSITATYLGDTTFVGSASAALIEKIAGAVSSISVTSGGNQSGTIGAPFTSPLVLTALDANGIPVPGRTITFTGTGLSFNPSTASTDSNGKVSVTITPNQIGALSGIAQIGSSTVTIQETGVALPAATITLSSSQNPSTMGNLVTFTATVSPSDASGAVTFMEGTTQLGTGTISGGMAAYATSALTIGTHSITARYGGDNNYSSANSSQLTQTVNAAITPDFTITNQTTGQQVSAAAGGSATYVISLGSVTGTTFSNQVMLSASGGPTGATYSFNPQTVTPGTSGGTSTLTVTVPKQQAAIMNVSSAGATLAALLLPFAYLKRSRRIRLMVWLLLTLAPLGAIIGCSGGKTTQPQSQNYTITITATSGSFTHTTTVSLTVQ